MKEQEHIIEIRQKSSLLYYLGKYLFKLLFVSLYRCKSSGQENIPDGTGFIIAPNHSIIPPFYHILESHKLQIFVFFFYLISPMVCVCSVFQLPIAYDIFNLRLTCYGCSWLRLRVTFLLDAQL